MRIRIATALAATFVLAGCGGGTLGEQALKKDAGSVQSLAAEGSLVAADAAKGSTTSPFTGVHSKYLAEAADKLGKTLAAAHARGSLERKRARIAKLAVGVSGSLRALHSHPADRPLARRLESSLAHAAKTASGLSK